MHSSSSDRLSLRQHAASLVVWGSVAVLAAGAAYWAVATHRLSWASIAAARGAIEDAAHAHPLLALLCYATLFLASALVLFPAQLWVILVGGFVFGFELGFAVSWVMATVSAVLVFLLARSALGAIYLDRVRRLIAPVEAAFQEDQAFYMLTLRLFPALPYCIVNVLPAALGARLRPYALTTAIGVIPYVAAYSFAGASAATMLAHPEPDLASFGKQLFPVLAALAALPLVAVLIRHQVRRWRAPAR